MITTSPADPTRRARAGAAALAAAATLAMGAVAVAGLASVTADGRPVVVTATVVGVSAGLAGAWLAALGRIRAAGALLLLSIVTPTFAAAVINLVPLLLGIVLLVDSFRGDGAFADR